MAKAKPEPGPMSWPVGDRRVSIQDFGQLVAAVRSGDTKPLIQFAADVFSEYQSVLGALKAIEEAGETVVRIAKVRQGKPTN